MEQFSYDKEGKNLTFIMTHKFVENCEVLYSLAPTYFIDTVILNITSIIWIAFVFGIWKNSVFPIQKILTLIPVLKGLVVMLYGLDM